MNEPSQSVPTAPAAESGRPGAAFDPDAREASFSRSLRNVLWMSSGGVVTRIVNLARGIILARMLTSFDFGVYGLGGSIVGVKERFSDIGAGNFLVYRPGEAGEHVETAFSVNLLLSSSLLALLAIAAPFLARFYREPLLTPVLVLLGLGVWARVNSSIHQSLLRIKGRFRALAIIDNVANLTWLLVAILLAWKGFGVWALVVSAVAAGAASAAMLVGTQRWRPHFHFSRRSLRLLGGFSFWYLGQGVAWYLVSNLDNLMVGRYLGMSLLGFYSLAFNYAMIPVTTVGNSMGGVAFADLPRLFRQPEEFWAVFLRYSRALALLGCFISFAALVAAPDVFPLLFGHQWDTSIVPFEILSVYAASRCLWLDAFLAYGDFRLSCVTGVVTVAAAAAAIGWGIRFGLAGVACAMLVVQVGFAMASLLVTTRSIRKLLQAMRTAAPYVAGGAAAAAVARGLRHWVLLGRMGEGGATLAITLAAYLVVYALLFRSELWSVLRMAAGVSPRRGAA